MIHSLARFDAGPGAPVYRAVCGYVSEDKTEFHDSTGTVIHDSRKVTCEECKR